MSLILALRKLIKILRADTGPRQVGLGLLFGCLIGLPPFGLLSVLLCFAFLLLSANLGAFLLSLGLAKALGVLGAAAWSGLGELILETAALRSFFTAVLNLPVISLMGLDRYLMMGGLVGGTLLGVAGFLLALFTLEPLRSAGARFVTQRPRIQRVTHSRPVRIPARVLFGKGRDPEAERKPDTWIRRGFAYPALVLVVLLGGGWFLFGDALARGGVEVMASQVTRKDVNIGGTSLSLLGGSLDLSDLLVREPAEEGQEVAGGEVAEGMEMRFDLGAAALLRRRFVVEDASVVDFTWHANAESAPDMPPPPDGEGETGSESEEEEEGVDLAGMVDWVEAHENQLRWALDKLDGFLQGGAEEPGPGAPGYDGRAEYVYRRTEQPMIQVAQTGVQNLRFDWTGSDGPLTRLQQLDLTLTGLSSNPVIHGDAIALNGTGSYGAGVITLEGVLDARRTSAAPHRLNIGLQFGEFGAARNLGLAAGRDLNLQIGLALDRSTRTIGEATCTGSFLADNPGKVSFQIGMGAEQRYLVEVEGLDMSRAGAFRRPSAVNLEQGQLKFTADFAFGGSNSLSGRLDVSAADLKLAPGTEKKLVGVEATQLCQGLNEIAKQRPLSLGFILGGTRSAPTLSLDDANLKHLLSELQAGLVAAGQERLAGEIDQRITGLQEKLGEQLGDQLGDGIGDVLPGKDADLKKAADEATEKASGLLKGFLKKKDDKKKGDGRP